MAIPKHLKEYQINAKNKDTAAKATILWLVGLAGVLFLLIPLSFSLLDNSHKNTSDIETEQEERFTGTKNETATEIIHYTSSTVNDPNLDEGKTEIRVKGANGRRTIAYEVSYEDGEEVSRKIVYEKVTQEPVNEIKAIGTKHYYTGYCSVQGTYRHRYAQCVGDYSPQAKANAEAKARECNINTRAVQGCYSTYR